MHGFYFILFHKGHNIKKKQTQIFTKNNYKHSYKVKRNIDSNILNKYIITNLIHLCQIKNV